MNLTESVIKNVLLSDNKNQILYNLNSLSGKEITQKTLTLASNLRATKKILSRERVILIMNDSPEFIYSFLALISIGCIPVPINPLIKESELEYILEDSKAVGVIVDDQQYLRLHKSIFCSKYILVDSVIVNLSSNNEKEYTLNYLSQYLEMSDILSAFDFEYDENSPIAFWQYTSGTTGNPKAVQHTHHTMLLNTEMFAKQTLKIDRTDIIISVSKMFFGYGLGNSLFFPLLIGASVVIDKEWFSIDNLKKNISLYQPTIFFGSPKVYLDILQNDKKFTLKDFTNIKLFISAGAALPFSIKKAWKNRFGKSIVNGIGSTEIGHIFLCDHEMDETEENTLGMPVKGYQVKICKADNPEELIDSYHEIGEMCVRPPVNTLSSYWNLPNANREKYKNGWYFSGDLCSKNQQGGYLYHGRKDDLFKVNGRWVSPWEIENIILNEFPEVNECALTFHLDENEFPTPILYVVNKAGTNTMALEKEIYTKLKLMTSSYKHPSRILFMEDLPRNSNGKVNKKQLVNHNVN